MTLFLRCVVLLAGLIACAPPARAQFVYEASAAQASTGTAGEPYYMSPRRVKAVVDAAVIAAGAGDLTEVQVGAGLTVTNGSGPVPSVAFTALADQRLWGNVSGGAAVPIALTAAQVRTMLEVPIFDSNDPGATNIFPQWDDTGNEVDWLSAANFRIAAGLVIGTNVQAFDAQLNGIAGLAYTGNAGLVVAVNGTEDGFELVSSASGLPTQTGNSGKFLTTDGSDASWATIPGGGDMLSTNNLSDLANAGTARTNLGGTTVGQALFMLTNPSAVTFLRVDAENTVTARSAANFKIDLSLNLVENTALSTWAGTSNITTVGTVGTGTWAGTTIGTTRGGTGLTSFAQGDLVYASATDTLARLAKSTSATRYLSNTGTSNAPAWAQIVLTDGVSGILPGANGGTGNGFFAVTGPTTSLRTFTFPNADATVLTTNAAVTVAQGGTGAATLTGLLQGNGTSAVTVVPNSTTVGQTLRVTASNTYGFGALDLADGDAVTGVLPDANVASTLARDSEVAASYAPIAAPSFTGIVTTVGAKVVTPTTSGGTTIDVTKGFSTRSISAPTEYTFSGTPATNGTFFQALIKNTDVVAHAVTVPTSFSLGAQASTTTFTVPAGGRVLATWLWDGTDYTLGGDLVSINDLTEDVSPAAGDYALTYDVSAGLPKKVLLSNLPSSGAPTDAEYVTAAVHGTLSAERVGTDTATVDVDFGTAGQAKWNFLPAGVAGSKTWGDASTDTVVWTFNRATGTDPTITFNSGSIALPALTLTTDLAVTEGGTGLSGGTSGGVPYYSSASTLASSAALAANALVLGGGAGAAPATTTTGTGVVTALGVNVGSAGAFVTFNGALGTPSSGTATNLDGTAASLTAGNATTAAGVTLVDSRGIAAEGNADALADDTYQAFKLITGRNAGETIAQWDLVYLNATDGEWHLADADESVAAGKAWGVAIAAGTDNNPLSVMVSGIIRNDGWTWGDEGVDLYVSDATPGAMTATAPATSGDVVKVVARTLSDDEIYLDVTHHFLLVE